MASSDVPPEVSGCLVFSIEALCFLIFKRLPVKSLCRFRCVCRSWNSLITSPSFVAEHFSFVSSAANKSYLLFNGFVKDRRIRPLYHPYQNQVTYLDPPFEAKNLDIVDVIHGVVCLQSSFFYSEEPIFLWNPSTHKYFSIPWSHSGRRNYHHRVRFGFQSSKNDFKVVATSCHPRGLGSPVCMVFSLQSGIWVSVAFDSTVGSYASVSASSCFFNGTIHWIASFASAQEGGNHTLALLCFDCEHDRLSKMGLPHELVLLPRMKILRYGGKLSVCNWPISVGDVELWVMDEYGVVSTWNRLFRIRCPADLRSIVMRGEDGDIMVYNDVQALAKKTKKRLRNRKLYLPVIAGVFEESLFSLEQTQAKSRDHRITL